MFESVSHCLVASKQQQLQRGRCAVIGAIPLTQYKELASHFLWTNRSKYLRTRSQVQANPQLIRDRDYIQEKTTTKSSDLHQNERTLCGMDRFDWTVRNRCTYL